MPHIQLKLSHEKKKTKKKNWTACMYDKPTPPMLSCHKQYWGISHSGFLPCIKHSTILRSEKLHKNWLPFTEDWLRNRQTNTLSNTLRKSKERILLNLPHSYSHFVTWNLNELLNDGDQCKGIELPPDGLAGGLRSVCVACRNIRPLTGTF